MNGPSLMVSTISGWSRVALDLNALDHCLPPPSAGAPGPCASAYALGLVYAAMADACAHTLETYPAAVATTPPKEMPGDIDRFVGGAAYGVLTAIFTDSAHDALIKAALSGLPNGGADWQSGISFANQLTSIWSQGRVADRVAPEPVYYVRPRGKHDVDPLNTDQGFYGQAWAGETSSVNLPDQLKPSIAPLGLTADDLDEAYEPISAPPDEESQFFLNSAIEVKAVGRLPSNIGTAGPMGPQLTIGTFWAYDGAANIGTPSRLYTQLVDQIMAARGGIGDAAELARLLALCNLAMANASIVAWRGKYEHAIARPVLWIRQAASEIQEPDWEPLGSPRSSRQSKYCTPRATEGAQILIAGRRDEDKFTPNFPAYPSGHATLGGACFKVLELFLGTTYLNEKHGEVALASKELDAGTRDPFTERPRPQRTVSFRTTDDLKYANAYSRILLGVHWDFDGTDGIAAGEIIGERTFENLYVTS